MSGGLLMIDVGFWLSVILIVTETASHTFSVPVWSQHWVKLQAQSVPSDMSTRDL